MAAKENQLLSDFIGFEYQQPEPNDSILFDYRNNPIQFERDWNLLMRVWDKIRKIGATDLKTDYGSLKQAQGSIANYLNYGGIDNVFNEIVNFIEWFNQNKM